MKKLTLGLTAGITLLALAVVGVRAGQRVRVIDIDNSASPKATTAVNVALTPAATATNTVTGLSKTFSNSVAAAATITVYSLTTNLIVSVDGSATNLAAVSYQMVTNVTITALSCATNVVIGSAVTNATGYTTQVGFTAAQANGILTNVNLLYQMLQP
jgi:hypothetical protein